MDVVVYNPQRRKKRTKDEGYSIPRVPGMVGDFGDFGTEASDSEPEEYKKKKKRRRTKVKAEVEDYESVTSISDEDESVPSNKSTVKPKAEEVVKALPVPTEFVKLREFDKEDTEEYCWGCDFRFGQSRIAGMHANMDDVWFAFDHNRDLPLDKLAELISKVQEERVYLPALSAGEDAEPWPEDIIKIHLRVHMVEPVLQLNADVKDANVIKSALKDTLIEMIDDGSGEKKPTPNTKNIKAYREFGVYNMKLYQVQRHFVNTGRIRRN